MVLWLSGRSRWINQLGALYWFSIGFWALTVGLQVHLISWLTPFWWGWFLHLGCTFIPVLMFHFAVVFAGKRNHATQLTLKAAYGIVIVFNLLNLLPGFFTNGIVYRDAYAYPKPALLYPLYFLLFVILIMWGTVLLARRVPSLSGRQKIILKFLIIAHAFAYLGGMDNFLIMVDIRIPPLYPLGLYLIPIYALAMIYATVRHQVLEITELP